MTEIYLDNSATTEPLPEVVNAIRKTLTDNYGNPSSLHKRGLRAEKILQQTRKRIAAYLGVKPSEIVFTSGGTEGNNLALRGIAGSYKNRGRHLITTAVEHKSVLNTCQQLEKEGFEVTYLPVDGTGHISLQRLARAVRNDTILVSIMHVNNEIGSIQPIAEIARIIKEKNKRTFLHVDGVQSFGKIYTKNVVNKIDLFTISAHKIHGPQGTGALYIKKGTNIKPLMSGGGQEDNIRPGTENMPGIAGLGAAVAKLPGLSEQKNHAEKTSSLKQYCHRKLKNNFPDAKINSPAEGAPHIINVSFKNIRGEVLLHALEGDGIYVATGSACHSNTGEESHVLRAINLPQEYLDGTLRISFSRHNTTGEIDYTVERIKTHLNNLF